MKTLIASTALILAAAGAHAGVVMEMVTRDMQGTEIDRMVFYTEANRSRMDQSGQSGSHSIIFLDDEFLYLDHATRQYMVMDEAMLAGIGEQVSAAMKEMEAQLAAMPPEQRAMVEQMLKGEMQGMGMAQSMPVLEIRKVGRDKWRSYNCELAEMLEDGVKIQEICSVDYSEVDGSGDLRASFDKMARLLAKLYDAMPFGGQGVSNPMEMLSELDGFPVRAVEFENGVAARETILESSEKQRIDDVKFALPDGYSRMDPFSP